MLPPPSGVLVVLDTAAAGEVALALSSALAGELKCELSVVYVESAASVAAAALSVTQVLPHAGAGWQPLRPDDVEQGFRSQAARLRRIAQAQAARHALRWSLRVIRGSLQDAPSLLADPSQLLLLVATPPSVLPSEGPAARLRRRPLVVLVGDDGEPNARALAVATQLARALGGTLQIRPHGLPAGSRGQLAGGGRPDVLVMNRPPPAQALALALEQLQCPVLLVG